MTRPSAWGPSRRWVVAVLAGLLGLALQPLPGADAWLRLQASLVGTLVVVVLGLRWSFDASPRSGSPVVDRRTSPEPR